MSKALRETKSFRCSRRWKGQANSPVQRRTTLWAPEVVSSRTTSVFSSQGQTDGKAKGSAPSGRLSATMPSTCGMTSPARWICTVSPTRTSSRSISSALCSVALATMTPPTLTGSSLATGVRAPVRPT